MKLFQNQKPEIELNDFRSILIVPFHLPFLNKEDGGGRGGEISKKWVRRKLILGVIFSLSAIIVAVTALAFWFRKSFFKGYGFRYF